MGLIGAAIGAAGSIFGGIAASKAMRKMKANVEAQKKNNQDWFDRRYNEDATQRADAQRILTMTEESIKNRNKAAAGAQAVMGGTEESVAATKAANSKKRLRIKQITSTTVSVVVALPPTNLAAELMTGIRKNTPKPREIHTRDMARGTSM